MQIANIRLKLDALGSDVFIDGVTPAEAVLLNTDHEINDKGQAVHDVTVVGETTRTDEEEILRLREKYVNAKDKKGESLAEKLYPGKSPKLPHTFKEAGFEVISKAVEPAKPAPAK